MKYITCPNCGQKVCMAGIGSEIVTICGKCKDTVIGRVDSEGAVHTVSKHERESKKRIG